MKYIITMNRRIRYIKVYNIVKRVGERQNALTKLFTRIFSQKGTQKGPM